jgi:pimeloyl-ACP methyl ester carboxylesterase
MTGFSQAIGAAYEDVGSGPVVLFSHGTMLDRTMFAPQSQALSDSYRVIAYDSRARTDRWEGPYSLDDLADDCVLLLDELGIEKCTLGGMSLGGYMAIEFALRYPERLTALMLIATMAEAYGPEAVAEYEREFGKLAEMTVVSDDVARWEAQIVFGPTTWEAKPSLPESWISRYMTLAGPAVYWETASWIRKEDRTARLSEIVVPALVIHGQDDFVLPIERAQRMATALPNACFVEVPGSGHTITLEQPECVNGALRQFLHRHVDPG